MSIIDQGTNHFLRSHPLVLFDQWYREAWASERDANAMACATADASGFPSVRYVLLKGRDERGFVFYTNYGSRKGQELGQRQQASLAFHWKSLRRQVRIEGTTETVSEAEADAYFATRPRDSQIAAWAAKQSEPMAERFDLEKRLMEYSLKYEGQRVPRPPFWSGYRVVPEKIEFWIDRPFRLHERLCFQRDGDGWSAGRIYP